MKILLAGSVRSVIMNIFKNARSTSARVRRLRNGRGASLNALLILVWPLIIGGCGLSPRQAENPTAPLDRDAMPEMARELFEPEREVARFDELLELTPPQQQQFLAFYHDRDQARMQPHYRINQYLKQRLSGIEFGTRTLPVAETVGRELGNCMSLALVTTAYARLVGVDIGWQLSPARPYYSSQGTVIYSADHIQTRLFAPPYGKSKGFSNANAPLRSYLLIDYFTDERPRRGPTLRENQMIALVYQNLGVEAMSEGRLADSYWLLREALEHDPRSGHTYNTLGVLHRRAGADELAEGLLRHALTLAGEELLILRNLRRLLLSQGRTEEAEQLQQRILALPDPDPYPALARGDQALRAGRLEQALASYREARRIAPYLHEVDQRMAQVYLEQGDLRRARRELQRARDNAIAGTDRRQYQAKLQSLQEIN